MRFLHLDLLQISLSSSRKIGEVVPNQHFLRTSHDIIGRMSPELCLLGDFHTHPYPETTVGEVVKQRLYDFSEADLDSFYHDELLWEGADNAPLMTVATICKLQRVPTTSEAKSISGNVVQFDVGQFRIWFNVCGGFTNRVDPDDEDNFDTHPSHGGDAIFVDLENRIHNTADTLIGLHQRG